MISYDAFLKIIYVFSFTFVAPSPAAAAVTKPKPAAPKAKPAAAGGDQGAVDVSRLDMRVGVIREVKLHPDADSLYVEQASCSPTSFNQINCVGQQTAAPLSA